MAITRASGAPALERTRLDPLKLHRCVRKGETGIRIFAPMTVRERDDAGEVTVDPTTGEPRTRTRFKLTAVFDVSQTDPLPGTEPVR